MQEDQKRDREFAMRDSEAPWPETVEELSAYIRDLVEQRHSYGTCVYAMSLAATAAFQFVAKQLGVTGFQASCADLDIIRRTRSIKGPFMLIDAEQALYPQYDLQKKLAVALTEWQPWLQEEAAKKLKDSPSAHPNVVAHWQRLAETKQ